MRRLLRALRESNDATGGYLARWLHCLRWMFRGHQAETVVVNGRPALIGCSCGQRFYRNEDLLARLR